MTLDLLAFGAHPDDVELSAGGLLLKARGKGYSVGIVDMSAGEKGTRGTPEIRRQEAESAAKLLGLSVRECLGLPDAQIFLDERSRSRVAEVIRRLRPRIVVCPYGEDRHPDHAHTGQIVREACYIAGLKNFPLPGEPHRPAKVLSYVLYQEVSPTFVVDITEQCEKKIELVRCYESQFAGAEVHPDSLLGRPSFADDFVARHLRFGSLIGKKYGEPYAFRGVVEVEDPVGLWRGRP